MIIISLNKQIHIYSVDTGAFYTNTEKRLHWKICKLKSEKKEIVSIINNSHFEKILKKLIPNKKDYKAFMKAKEDELKFNNKNIKLKGEYSEDDYISIINTLSEYKKYLGYKNHKNKLINNAKRDLLSKLSKSVKCNDNSKNKKIRKLSHDCIIDKNIISVFDSSLTRMLGLKIDELSTDIIIIKVYYFDIIKDLILNGFEYNGEKYKFFTASAGQIRTKKTVFIKQSLWDKFEKTLMCGLTMDLINKKGGINVNKYLVYLALSNSATDLWEDFNIRKTIVVDDLETMVNGEVDFVDDKTYTIERKRIDVPIPHTDGCGMLLPSVSNKNFMIRLPWIKGLMAVFPFDEFIKQANEDDNSIRHEIIKDIYGIEHNIFEEDIQIIFTKSQFKMYKYYTNWNEYINSFIKYDCKAGICNVEEDYIPNAKINYQMIQTLNNMTDDELIKISKKSMDKLNNITSTVKSMLEVFGVTKYNTNKTNLQKALEIYPELLNDIYTKNTLRDIKDSLVKEYRSAKLDIKGKYTFIIPDLYAFCERLFLGIENPNGLLKDGQVSCRLYKNIDKLDCLRSPHLYREHAVRENIFNEEISKWFATDALYTSCHDLISKILQFDVDGDKSLVVADKILISVAERHMKDVVPLYYNMNKADPIQLDNNKIYDGLNAAYTGGNIGAKSNDICKIFNSEKVGKDELIAIKYLCMENNFVIDYAKTLYKPVRPKEIDILIKKFTKSKTPYFFIYAKDKLSNQVEPKNNSVVNRLDTIIINKRLKFPLKEFGKFDYNLLMNNSEIHIDNELLKEYEKLNRKYHFKINMKDPSNTNISFIAEDIRDHLSKFKYSKIEITDMLIKYLYGVKNSKSKESLWFCYGDIIFDNLKRNIGSKTTVCEKCGKRFEKDSPAQKRCIDCQGYQPIETKTIGCIDCGKEVIVDSKDSETCRCNECRGVHLKQIKREQNKRYYSKLKIK